MGDCHCDGHVCAGMCVHMHVCVGTCLCAHARVCVCVCESMLVDRYWEEEDESQVKLSSKGNKMCKDYKARILEILEEAKVATA